MANCLCKKFFPMIYPLSRVHPLQMRMMDRQKIVP